MRIPLRRSFDQAHRSLLRGGEGSHLFEPDRSPLPEGRLDRAPGFLDHGGMTVQRRDVLLAPALVALASEAAGAAPGSATPGSSTAARPGPICLFSKHLPKMPPGALARAIKGLGFAGVDLTVRPGGHVAPAEVERELPRAVEAIRAEGLAVPLVTTELLEAKDPSARPILTTAGKLGVPLFKPGYYKYAYQDVHRELRAAGASLRGLYELGRRAKVQLGFHNHGDCLGGPVWDAARIIEPLDPRWAGYYFDTRHAFAEGGQSAWKVATHLVGPRVKAVSVKDFHWEKTSKGWGIRKVPLGEGMVDVAGIFAILAKHNFSGPISLHLEYTIEGGEDAVLKAAERDLGVLRKKLAEVYGTA
jgi:sugar phosphate isomerase/epimerase